MSEDISIKVLCFSHVQFALGRQELELRLAAGSTVADLEREVRTLGGEALARIPLRAAVNKAFVDSDALLCDGDEVAFIPPVQGG